MVEATADRRLGIGLVGAGMVGQTAHLANLVDLPRARVVALAELRPELGRLAAARFDVPKVYPDHHALLADGQVEAVVVVTRRAATGPITRDALLAGRHVLAEKPMAHALEQARILVDLARTRRLVLSVGYMKRHDAGLARGKAMLDDIRASGTLGRPLLYRVWSFHGDFACGLDGFVMTEEPRPDGLELWPLAPVWLPAVHTGEYADFLNVFVHDINLLRHLVDGPVTLQAVDFRRANGRLALLDCAGVPGALEMAVVDLAEWREGVEIVFEKGVLTIEFAAPMLRNVPARVSLRRGGEAGETVTPDIPWSWAFKRQARAFVDDVLDGTRPLADGADALEDLRLAEAMWRYHLRDVDDDGDACARHAVGGD